jgi:hypothetical protein
MVAQDSLSGMALNISAAQKNQELLLSPISYWEGAIRTTGVSQQKPVSGKGYLEMTGYGSPIVGMQASRNRAGLQEPAPGFTKSSWKIPIPALRCAPTLCAKKMPSWPVQILVRCMPIWFA